MTREKIVHAKNTRACKRCRIVGHWFGDRKDDGTFHNDVVSSATAISANATSTSRRDN